MKCQKSCTSISIVSSLGITENEYTIQKNIPSSEPIDKAIMKLQFYPSIILIKSKINTGNSFLFTEIETDDVDEEIRSLNSKKSVTQNDIPAKILKNCKFNYTSFAKTFQLNFKNS